MSAPPAAGETATERILRVQRDVALALGALTSLSEVVPRMIEILGPTVSLDGGGLYLLGEQGRSFRIVSHAGLSEAFVAEFGCLDSGPTTMGPVAPGRPAFGRYADLAPAMTEARRNEGLRAVSVIPILHEGQVIAVLSLASHTLDELPPTTCTMLETLAPTIGAILVRLRAEAALRESERRRLELEKLAATGDLAAKVAHEINNPLAGIKGCMHLVKETLPKDFPHLEYLRRVDREIDRIARIVRQMLGLYRARSTAEAKTVVHEAIREVAAMLEPICRGRGIRVEVDLCPDWVVARLTDDEIRQVLYNLLLNAIEVSPEGGVVRVSTRVADDRIELTVADEGPGIPAGIRGRVFEPHFSTKTGAAGGLGLGLPICKGIVEARHGSIDFDSGPEGGCVFRVAVPRRAP